MTDQAKLPPVLVRSDFDNDEEYADYVATETLADPLASSDDFDQRRKAMIASAKFTLADLEGQRTSINLSIPTRNLEKLRAQALRRRVPYQTYINEILHQAARNP